MTEGRTIGKGNCAWRGIVRGRGPSGLLGNSTGESKDIPDALTLSFWTARPSAYVKYDYADRDDQAESGSRPRDDKPRPFQFLCTTNRT